MSAYLVIGIVPFTELFQDTLELFHFLFKLLLFMSQLRDDGTMRQEGEVDSFETQCQ